MKGNAGGHLGGAGSTTNAATARESIPRLTAPFPTQLDFIPAPPSLGGEGDSSDGQGTPSVVSVHRLDNFLALPSQQNGLPQLANLFCPIPQSWKVLGTLIIICVLLLKFEKSTAFLLKTCYCSPFPPNTMLKIRRNCS